MKDWENCKYEKNENKARIQNDLSQYLNEWKERELEKSNFWVLNVELLTKFQNKNIFKKLTSLKNKLIKRSSMKLF
jgi:hypothetical protein